VLVALALATAASGITIWTNSTPIAINDAPHCGTFSISNVSQPIAVNDSASPPTPANPYPSNITVSNVLGTVTDVDVTLGRISHTFPDDIDVLLVGPNGAKVLLMSDVAGATDAVQVSITLDDAAASALPDTNPLAAGTFQPTNFGAGDTFPAPAPAAPYSSTLSAFNGADPTGTWSLYVVDDSTMDSGSLAYWTLTVTVSVPGPCPFKANPYPSTIPVSGLGAIGDVNVTLTDFSHALPDDVDALVVGPTGAAAMVLSDVGDNFTVSALDITLDDEAASSLPDSNLLSSGSFKPTDFVPGDPMPAPAPAGPYPSALSTFDGTSPNGTWSLYVADDLGGSSGSIDGGWTLVFAAPTAVVAKDFGARLVSGTVALSWRTASELELAGFNLYRSSPAGKTVRLNKGLIEASHPGTARGATYRFTDRSVRPHAAYTYRLELVQLNGARVFGGAVTLRAGR
jgi:subtilisin-like proprotein convertase family protein